ncbi:hypothetical protein GCM10007198_20000 [Microbacterium aerolatum]|nr:hypothetical protein GCM10007198_20000 [Microbacterium aerolatum]
MSSFIQDSGSSDRVAVKSPPASIGPIPVSVTVQVDGSSRSTGGSDVGEGALDVGDGTGSVVVASGTGLAVAHPANISAPKAAAIMKAVRLRDISDSSALRGARCRTLRIG